VQDAGDAAASAVFEIKKIVAINNSRFISYVLVTTPVPVPTLVPVPVPVAGLIVIVTGLEVAEAPYESVAVAVIVCCPIIAVPETIPLPL
jgi:hypothetical protein